MYKRQIIVVSRNIWYRLNQDIRWGSLGRGVKRQWGCRTAQFFYSSRATLADRMAPYPDGSNPRWQRGPFRKTSNGHNQQHVIRSTSCLVLGWGFRQGRIELHYFGYAEIQDGDVVLKIPTAISLKHIIRFTLCMYTDNTLPLDCLLTVDVYDTGLETYFAREGN